MEGLFDQFDMLELALVVFGSLIVALWFGRGKSLKSKLLGGLVKPLVFGALLFGGFQLFGGGADEGAQPGVSQEDLMKILGQQ